MLKIKTLPVVLMTLAFFSSNSWAMLEEVPEKQCIVKSQDSGDSYYPRPSYHVFQGKNYTTTNCPDCKNRNEIHRRNVEKQTNPKNKNNNDKPRKPREKEKS